MNRQRRSPPQRHSSLPASLHRLMVPGPPQPLQDADEDETDDILQQRPDEGGGIPFEGAPDPVHPASAPAERPQLPPLRLSAGVFQDVGVVEHPVSRRPSRSPALSGGRQPAVAAIPPLPLPPLPPTLRTDPAYYASTSSVPSVHSISPPGPHLQPISWGPERAFRSPPAGGGGHHDSSDRSVPPLPRTYRHPSPIGARSSIAATPPPLPVAGPSRPPTGPPGRGRKRRPREQTAQTALGTQDTVAAGGGSAPLVPQRRDASEGEHGEHDNFFCRTVHMGHVNTNRVDFGSGAPAPSTSRAAGGGSEAGQWAVWAEDVRAGRRPEAGPSSRRIAESRRGSPASLAAVNYPVAVGATAYSVTTLSPLRATILRPAVDRASGREGGWGESESSGAAGGRSVSREWEGGGGGGEVKRSASDTEGEGGRGGRRGKRRRGERERARERRGESEQQQESTTSSSSSEQAQAPKSKKTLIACHFCRGKQPFPARHGRSPSGAGPGLLCAVCCVLCADPCRHDSPEAALRRTEAVLCELQEARPPLHLRAAAQAARPRQDAQGDWHRNRTHEAHEASRSGRLAADGSCAAASGGGGCGGGCGGGGGGGGGGRREWQHARRRCWEDQEESEHGRPDPHDHRGRPGPGRRGTLERCRHRGVFPVCEY